jgi:organic radical activating enzyme
MLIKITDKCSMGCTHCLSDCKPDGQHMSFETFQKAVSFNFSRAGNSPILISGGEPTEHPEFKKFLSYVLGYKKFQEKVNSKKYPPIIVTTNGLWLSKHMDFVKLLEETNIVSDDIMFQVVVDDRYYPIHVNEDILMSSELILIGHNVLSIYPQGRALQNNIPWNRKSSNCFNVRAIAKQIENPTLERIITMQNLRGHMCTPHIDIGGNIKLGESRLCTICSSIYKTDKEIINDIINFKCHQCDFINESLPPLYKQFVE